MKINYNLKQLYKGIYLITIKDQYDLGMTFCRLQEFYESSFKDIRGKSFTMTDFQRIYSKKHGNGAFTYPRDWAGFNIPDFAIHKFMSVTFADWGNFYDKTIEEIYNKINKQHDSNMPYYVIGSEPKHKETIDHELCHALYYLIPAYKEHVNLIISKLNCVTFTNFKERLLKMGYSKPVILDEINAYVCIDPFHLTDNIKMNKKEHKNFISVQKDLKELFVSNIRKLK